MQTGTAGRELIEAHQVVHQPEVPTFHLVPVRRSDLGLKIEHLLCLGLGVLDASERKGCRHVSLILRANLGVLIEAVVLLVRQTQSTLSGKHHISVRVAWVRFCLQRHQPRHRLTREATHHPGEVRQSLHGIDRG